MTLFKNFWWVFAVPLLVLHFNNNKLSIQLVELKLWLHHWPILISGLSRPYHTMLEQQYPTHSSDAPSYYPLNEDHFPIAQKHVDSSQNDPLKIMSPVTLASAHEPSRAPHYSQNRSKIFSWPQSCHAMAFSVLFFLLWSPSISELLPDWPGWPEGSQLKVSVFVLFTHT